MSAFNKFNQFVADMGNKVHNLNSDTLKVAFTNTAPVATNTIFANIVEIAGGNGYTAGGFTVTGQSYVQSGGVAKLSGSLATPTLTATGAVGPFRYAVLYNLTTASDNLIGWWDNGSSVTLSATQTFTVALDPTNGILQNS